MQFILFIENTLLMYKKTALFKTKKTLKRKDIYTPTPIPAPALAPSPSFTENPFSSSSSGGYPQIFGGVGRNNFTYRLYSLISNKLLHTLPQVPSFCKGHNILFLQVI